MEGVEAAAVWLVLAAIQSLPLLIVAAMAKFMHRSMAAVVLIAAFGLLVYADVWAYRRLADDANGLYFVFLPGEIGAGILAVCLIDVLVRLGARRYRRAGLDSN